MTRQFNLHKQNAKIENSLRVAGTPARISSKKGACHPPRSRRSRVASTHSASAPWAYGCDPEIVSPAKGSDTRRSFLPPGCGELRAAVLLARRGKLRGRMRATLMFPGCNGGFSSARGRQAFSQSLRPSRREETLRHSCPLRDCTFSKYYYHPLPRFAAIKSTFCRDNRQLYAVSSLMADFADISASKALYHCKPTILQILRQIIRCFKGLSGFCSAKAVFFCRITKKTTFCRAKAGFICRITKKPSFCSAMGKCPAVPAKAKGERNGRKTLSLYV